MISNKALLLILVYVLLFFPKISWAQTPPVLTATGDQYYCPLGPQKIVTNFNITNPSNVEIKNIYIQISEGYLKGEDILKLNGAFANISASPFNTTEGKIVLSWIGTGTANTNDLITAVNNVVFQNSSATPTGTRIFSITIGTANYLPSNGHYYEFISAANITWGDAKIAAEGKKYFNALQGYLATITSAEEAQICGEQAAGQGWIGGSDAETEGVWKWVTGPEAGMIFWNGLANGSSPSGVYSNWASGEPNDWPNTNIPKEENYAHIYQTGKWNDYPNYNTSITGYIVEYGGMSGDPVLNISASTKITIPEITSTTANSNCGAGTVTLSATSNTGTVLWFGTQTGGSKLGSGNTFITPNISSTTTYYAFASADGICETGARTPVIATIYTIPTITNVSNATICGAGIGTLSATASSGVINWYDASSGGNLVGSGTSFTSPALTSTTTYFVEATENGCTSLTRTPIILNVQYTATPTGLAAQTFCDIENAKISNLTATGTNILWYLTATGGTSLNRATILANNTYYASQTVNGCESPVRMPVNVSIYETVIPSTNVTTIFECDNASDGDDTNGFSIFDLTINENDLLNGKSVSDFTISYYTDSAYLNQIVNPTSFENTVINGQTIYVRISNNIDTICFSDNSFKIQVNSLPIITPFIVLKNCDEDGTPDGFTDYNLNEANSILTNGDTSLIVSYYLTQNEANTLGATPLNPVPFNNSTANTVYARIENSNGCFRVATANLQVSTTSFLNGFMETLESCDNDAVIDGLSTFDLTLASANIMAEFPLGQNLSVYYYRNLTDAQLELNEINPQNNYLSETPFSQILYVRVESDDNGDCFGIGPHLTLTVHPRPEFEVEPEAIVCLNLPPITLETFNANDVYTYEWTNESNTVISTQPNASVSSGGIYTVVATSGLNCNSFSKTVTVAESNVANLNLNDITITDDSNDNSISINTQNLGIGNYEFSLNDVFGNYQDEPAFKNVAPGIHTIYIQDKNGCGISSVEVSVIGFPKFFTPNNDGHNDTWQIKGVSDNFYSTSLIYIFDRFGKFLIQIDPKSDGWNGFFNGKMLPATDYWFSAQLIDENGTIREKKGHFSLITR